MMLSGERKLIRDDGGFSTVGMVIALLLTLSLVFSAAQVYQAQRTGAEIQEVADAAALAAENEVAEFIIAVRACDAVVLSLALSGITITALGAAAICTPFTAEYSEPLLAAGRNLLQTRVSFGEKAAKALNAMQQALPFIAAARAMAVAQANGSKGDGPNYLAIAILDPLQGNDVSSIGSDDGKEVLDRIDDAVSEEERKIRVAERHAERAQESKHRAYMHDCGFDWDYCQYERAEALAHLHGALNPWYRSDSSWSFSVALARAKAYYQARAQNEQVRDHAHEDDRVRSALRKVFYAFAYEEVSKGYVRDDGETFNAYFPLLPRNVAELRTTGLYTEQLFPVSAADGVQCMHAYEGCPRATGTITWGTIKQMEDNGMAECPSCHFSASMMAQVASATSNVPSGFEYHYRIIAQEAKTYQQERAAIAGELDGTKKTIASWFSDLWEAARSLTGVRLEAYPPGAHGAIALVADMSEVPTATGSAGFASYRGSVGGRLAIAGAALVEESSDGSGTVLTSLLDGIGHKAEGHSRISDVVLSCWSGMLQAYCSGQRAVTSAVRKALDGFSWFSPVNLGTWVVGKLTDGLQGLGLQPVNLSAPKAALINSGYVAAASESSFAARFVTVKNAAVNLSGSNALLQTVLSDAEKKALLDVSFGGGDIQIATIAPLGPSGPKVPITISLPVTKSDAKASLLAITGILANGIEELITGVKRWK